MPHFHIKPPCTQRLRGERIGKKSIRERRPFLFAADWLLHAYINYNNLCKSSQSQSFTISDYRTINFNLTLNSVSIYNVNEF